MIFSKNLKFNNYNFYLGVIFIIWFSSIFFYFFFNDFIKAGGLENGVKFGNDTNFYLDEASKILIGKASAFDYESKFGYILFLIPFVYFNIPLIFIVFFQIFLTAISGYCLYRISSKYFCKLSGIICVALFLFYLPIQIRSFYILTEMLFIDITIILSYFIVFYKKKYLPIIIFLLFSLISIRPNGVLYLFSILLCAFIFLIKYQKYNYLYLFIIILLISILPIVNLLNSYLVDLNLIEGIHERGIVWGWSFEENQRCEDTGVPCLGIEFINNNYQNNVVGVLKFISANFFSFIYVFFLKIFWLLARVRPYYSDLHNYYILFFNFIFYLGLFYGYLKRPKNNFSVNIILFFILLSIILVGITFADWSSRFSLYFLPLLMIFSSYGILNYLKKIFNFFQKKIVTD